MLPSDYYEDIPRLKDDILATVFISVEHTAQIRRWHNKAKSETMMILSVTAIGSTVFVLDASEGPMH